MRLVLGDYKDFSCKMSLATKILLQTLVENTQFSSSVSYYVLTDSNSIGSESLLSTSSGLKIYV